MKNILFVINSLEKEYNNFLHLMEIYKNIKINNKKDEQFTIFIIQLIALIYRKLFIQSSGIYKVLKKYNIYNRNYKLYKICNSKNSLDSLSELLIYEMPYNLSFTKENIPIIKDVFCKEIETNIINFLNQQIFSNLEFKNKDKNIIKGISIKDFINLFINKQIVHLDVNIEEKNYNQILILQNISLGGYNGELIVNILLLDLILPLLKIIPDIIIFLKNKIYKDV